MARPVKWSRDLHLIRDKATGARTETWSRQEIEVLFQVGRATAQTLMKAIGGVQSVAGAHFVERSSLLAFLDAMIAAASVDEAMRERLAAADPVPRPRTLRVSLPADLRQAMLPDLPPNIVLEPGRLEIRAETAEAMLKSLVALAMVMQNDLERFRGAVEPLEQRSMFEGSAPGFAVQNGAETETQGSNAWEYRLCALSQPDRPGNCTCSLGTSVGTLKPG